MKPSIKFPLSLLAIVTLLVLSVGPAAASGGAPGSATEPVAGALPVAPAACTMSDWSAWSKYFTPIVPPSAMFPAGNPPGRPIPTPNPSQALLFAWLNIFFANPPEPALAAHAEEVARGPDHSTIIGHGPAKSQPASVNKWAVGGVLMQAAYPGPIFEPFNNFYGETWREIPDKWGAYAYRGADSVTFDYEQVVKNAMPTDGTYSMKIAGSVPFEAGISRTINVPPGSEVKVSVMYALYDHGGYHGDQVWQYDWAALGVKADDCDAKWVNGPWHGQWLPLEYTLTAGPEGRIMIFLQVISMLPENTNAYFDDVQVWVNGQPFTG